VRTVIAPLDPEVESQLRGLDRRRADIARRYIRRLMLEPYLGYPLRRGRLASERCRAVRFDRGDDPDDLFGGRPRATRAGNQDPSRGPAWRIVYWVRETPDRRLRVIVVLAVGIAHPSPGTLSAFDLATGMLGEALRYYDDELLSPAHRADGA
jgi:hypothetical protein